MQVMKLKDYCTDTTAIASQKEAEIEQKIQDFKLEVESAALYLSALFSHAAAVLSKSQLYQYLNKALCKTEDKFKLPTPALCFFACGLENPGKCNVLSEVFLLPKLGVDLKEGIENVLKIYKETEKVLLQKYGPSGLLRSNAGTLTPTFERPELVFEVLSQACTNLSIELKDSCDIILNTDANTIYDEDKKKYEIMQGNQRTSTELISLYEGWLNEFPVVAIIDGLSSKDVENVTLLHSQLGQKCLILNSFASTDASLTALNNKQCNGFVCDLSKNSSLSNINDCINKFEQTGLSTGMMFGSASLDFSHSAFSVDLAVALSSTFVYIGAPSGAERMNKLNRIISIYSELVQNSKYEPRSMYKFSEPEPIVDQTEVPESE
jgi:enolase